MPNQTMVYSCSGAEQEYTMVWFGIFLYFLIFSLKIRFCEQSVFAKSPLPQNFTPRDAHCCWQWASKKKLGQGSLDILILKWLLYLIDQGTHQLSCISTKYQLTLQIVTHHNLWLFIYLKSVFWNLIPDFWNFISEISISEICHWISSDFRIVRFQNCSAIALAMSILQWPPPQTSHDLPLTSHDLPWVFQLRSFFLLP